MACQAPTRGQLLPLGTFGLPVQGHAKKAKSTQKHGPPQAPGAPWGGTLSTPRVPGQPRRVDPLTEWRGNRTHSFPPSTYSVNRTPRMDVETEPIHFTQDDHHSIQGTNSWCPHRFPDSSDYRRRRSKKGVESLSHLFSDRSPYGAQLGP